LQAVFNRTSNRISLYVTGLIALFGLVLGRLVCGWLCPFGLIQELLYRIHSRKVRVGPTPLRYLKYAVLIILVILMPLLIRDVFGVGDPWFCKLVCPAGTLEAALPLMALNASLRGAAGWLFAWKLTLLAATVASSVVIYRPFCRFVCPLGAIYGLLNRISFVQLTFKESTCTHCGACKAVCRMGVDPSVSTTDPECIRCGDCVAICPVHALSLGMPSSQPKKSPVTD
jgi:polyferredoxin